MGYLVLALALFVGVCGFDKNLDGSSDSNKLTIEREVESKESTLVRDYVIETMEHEQNQNGLENLEEHEMSAQSSHKEISHAGEQSADENNQDRIVEESIIKRVELSDGKIIIDVVKGYNACDAEGYEVIATLENLELTAFRYKSYEKTDQICSLVFQEQFEKIELELCSDVMLSDILIKNVRAWNQDLYLLDALE